MSVQLLALLMVNIQAVPQGMLNRLSAEVADTMDGFSLRKVFLVAALTNDFVGAKTLGVQAMQCEEQLKPDVALRTTALLRLACLKAIQHGLSY